MDANTIFTGELLLTEYKVAKQMYADNYSRRTDDTLHSAKNKLAHWFIEHGDQLLAAAKGNVSE